MRNVIVTGGSRGLGLGLARRLTRAGYRVIALARKETNQLTLAMEEAERAHPGSFHFVPFDLAETAAIATLVKSLRNAHGPIYGLVNNAAVGFDGVLALMPNAQIEQLVRINTLSPIVLTKYVVRAMMADGGGRIVNVASIVGFTGYSGLSVYAAPNAPMLGFTRPETAAGAPRIWAHGDGPGDFPRIDGDIERLAGDALGAAEARPTTIEDRALYIYTSGTTGLPKAARFSHARLMQWSHWFAGMMDTRASDRMYNCLPMYHSVGGVLATGAVLVGGGSVVIRDKFS